MNQHLSLSEDLSGENPSNKMINPLERTLLNTNDTSMSQPNSPMPNFEISVQIPNPEQNQEQRYTDSFLLLLQETHPKLLHWINNRFFQFGTAK